MAELTVDYGQKIYLTSRWFVYEDDYENLEITSQPSWAAATATFEYNIPVGAEIVGAYVHSEWSYPTDGNGFDAKTVNGTWVPNDGNVNVTIDPASTSLDVIFRFRVNGSASYPTGNRDGSTTISNIYLVIQYKWNGLVYFVVSGELTPYQIYHAEGDNLVQYQLFKAEDNKLVLY